MNVGSTAHQISPLSITNQLFREHQVGIAEGHHRVLRVFQRTHHPAPPSREPPHSSDHEASQARYQEKQGVRHRRHSGGDIVTLP